MIEFLEDLIDNDPTCEFPREEFVSGTFKPRTGDAVADEWFSEIAEGKVPDFMAAFDAEDQEKLKSILKKKPSAEEALVKAKTEMPEDFDDDYTKELTDG